MAAKTVVWAMPFAREELETAPMSSGATSYRLPLNIRCSSIATGGDGKAQTLRLSAEGPTEFRYLESVGAPGPNLVLAHCIWLDDEELVMMANSRVKATHCPSANLKVASGLAKVPEMLELGVNVSLGADGAPANNNLDMFMEMRLAGLIHKARLDDERTMPASTVLEMATIGGARALGLEDKIGSIEPGKLADVIVIDRSGLHNQPMNESDPMTQVVYQLRSSDVDTVIVGWADLAKRWRVHDSRRG